MKKPLLVTDLAGVFVLITSSALIGVVCNNLRDTPLPLRYAAPASRLNDTVKDIRMDGDNDSIMPQSADVDISKDEVLQISSDRSGLILDARPEIFYHLGHVPTAISLPRENFKAGYMAAREKLISSRNQLIIVYCDGGDCRDSEMVAEALGRLGYNKVRVFRGGWQAWQASSYPEER